MTNYVQHMATLAPTETGVTVRQWGDGRMTTLYVAGPMTGLPEFNYPAFNEASERLRAAGFRVLNPTDVEQHNPTPGAHQNWDWYMRHALRMVLDADALAVLPGWENSRGARLEVTVAEALGMDVRPADRWLS